METFRVSAPEKMPPSTIEGETVDNHCLCQKWSHNHRVLQGTSVTGACDRQFIQNVLRGKFVKEGLTCLQLVSSFCTITRDHYVAVTVQETSEKYGWEVLLYPPYSPDLSPPDFDLFPKLKKPLCGKRFGTIDEVSNEMT